MQRETPSFPCFVSRWEIGPVSGVAVGTNGMCTLSSAGPKLIQSWSLRAKRQRSRPCRGDHVGLAQQHEMLP